MGQRKLFYFDPRRIRNLKDIAHLSTRSPYSYTNSSTRDYFQSCDHCLASEGGFFEIFEELTNSENYHICAACISRLRIERRKLLEKGQINLSLRF